MKEAAYREERLGRVAQRRALGAQILQLLRGVRLVAPQARDAVVAEEADLGICFDGDADRCMVVDEQGRIQKR